LLKKKRLAQAKDDSMKNVTLNNGVVMPMLGYGVFQISNDDCERCVLDAMDVGYRAIDTAQIYRNEDGVGKAMTKSGIARSELFITSKVWIANCSYDKAKASILESLDKLQTNYIDLMLIHRPFNDYYGAYRAMEELYEQGILKAIGVSNFDSERLIDLCTFAKVIPALNQVETHPFYQQAKAKVIMDKYGVIHQSWAPFAEGKNNFFSNPMLMGIGEKYGKSVAQVTLAYLMQLGIVVIPKSSHKERMAENFNVFDLTLTHEEMLAIAGLDEDQPLWVFEDEALAGMLRYH
jgi:2,5-diketo-D-gluconate reductase A